MTTPETTQIPLDWIRSVNPDLRKLDDIPLSGGIPPFPWDNLSNNLSHFFDIEGLKISPGEIQWRSHEDLYAGLGTPLWPLHFNIAPLDGIATWVMPEQEVSLFMSLLLLKKIEPLDIQDRSFQDAFYRFFILEVFHQLEQLKYNTALTPLLRGETDLPSQPALCLDVTISTPEQDFTGRLLFSREMRLSLKKLLEKQNRPIVLNHIAEKAEVIVHLVGGKTTLSLKQWTKVNAGDIVLLDNCTLDVGEDKGKVVLTLNGNPLYRAKIKGGNLKILESPQFYEVETPMAIKEDNEEENEDFDEEDSEFDDENFTEEELSDIEEEEPEDEKESAKEDDISSDENILEDDISEEHELIDEETNEAKTETVPISTDASIQPKTSPKRERSSPEKKVDVPMEGGVKAPLKPSDIPITLVVEVGRMQLPIKQLLELEPGNLLEMDVHPEKGVDLVMNGKVVGRGELIRLGDVLGVRVLEVGA